MPRPQRISARERSLVGETQDEDDGTQENSIANENTIDNASEQDDGVKTGQVADGEIDLSRRVARRLGWVPKEEWTRPAESWTDAPEFLDYTTKRLTKLEERVRRTGQVAEDMAENARREARAQAEAELREAARSGDEEKAVTAAKKVADNSGPHPQTAAWMARNTWFNEDQEAQAVAVTAITRATKEGLSIEAQLQAGEAAVKRRFPEHFETREARSEARLSELRTPPPAVTGGSRGSVTQSKPKEKGWSDIPSADRHQMHRFVKEGMRHGKTEAECTAAMAASYWRDKA